MSMPSGQRFEPERLTIQAGDTVTWTNDAGDAHTVTAYEEAIPDGAPFFSSGDVDSEQAARENMGRTLIGPGESYEFTFEEPGTYRYFCIPHEEAGMRGTIVVE